MSSPVIYEVNAKGSNSIREGYADLVRDHLERLLREPGFLKASWFTRRPEDEGLEPGDYFLWTLLYLVKDRASLDAYIQGPGQILRQEAKQKFQGEIEVNRRILTAVDSAL